jgi:hypothetical protein
MKNKICMMLVMCMVMLLSGSAHATIADWQTLAASTTGNVVNDSGLGDGVTGGTGYVFDGTASIAYDYGTLNVNPAAADNGSAIEAIFNLSDPGDWDHMIEQNGWNNAEVMRLNHETWANGGIGISYPGKGDFGFGMTGIDDTDVHVVWVSNADTTMTVYVDGVDVGSTPGGTDLWLNGGLGRLGGLIDEAYVTGTIYGIASYDQALTSGQVTALYNAVPEPATMLLLGLGGVLLRRKKR